jgi:hypothetical protein
VSGKTLIAVGAIFFCGLAATPAFAVSSVTLTATPGAGEIEVQATGSADGCSAADYCSAQNLEIVAIPSDDSSCDDAELYSAQAQETLPTSGGPFDYEVNVTVQSGQDYAVCAYITTTTDGVSAPVAYSQPVAVSVAPQPCPSGTSPSLTLQVPAVVAYGRKATLTVNDPNGDSIDTATITMQSSTSGSVFYEHQLSDSEINSLEQSNPEQFFIQLLATNGSADVTLQYTEQISSDDLTSEASCVEQVTKLVTGTRGQRPTVQFANNWGDLGQDAAVRFAAPTRCVLTEPLGGSIVISGHGARLVATSDDVCSAGWTERGRIPGVSVSQASSGVASSVVFSPSGSNREFRVVVSLAGKVVKRGWLSASYSTYPAMRVYQGTDQYINYCIDDNQTVFSYQGRLFCWQDGGVIASVELTLKP